jgi:hypothetical protein
METSRDKEVSEAARLLGKRGGAKGGRARAAALTSEERQRIARNAVNARWARQKAQREEVQAHA